MKYCNIINSVLALQVLTASLPNDREPCEIKVVSNHTCSLHTCVCAGSRKERVRLSRLINGRNQFNSWGFPQVPHSGPGLCQTVETISFEFGLKPLGASNIGSDSKGCSHSMRNSASLFIRPSNSTSLFIRLSSSASLFIRPSNSTSLFIRPSNSASLFIRPSGSESCSSDRVAALAVHQTEWQHKLFIRIEKTARAFQRIHSGGSKQQGLFYCGDINASYQRFQQVFFKSGEKPLEHRLITGLDQGRQTCRPGSVPGYSCLTAKSEFKCPGVGRSRDTPAA
jgi:hypothetical protein